MKQIAVTLTAMLSLPSLAVADSDQQSERKRVLEEIVVKAPKTNQSLSEVGVAASVVDRETLIESGGFDPSAIEDFAPNVELDTDPQSPVIGIRGFSTETDNVGFEPSVGLSFDDLALNRPEFISDGMFDIDRVDVFRGPQGSLFGKNTIAGVINFTSVEPDSNVGNVAMITAGTRDEERLEAGGNMSFFDDMLGLRIAGVRWQKDGYIYNRFLDRNEADLDQRAIRAKAVIDTDSGWIVRASTQFSNTLSKYPPWQLMNASDDTLAYLEDFDPEIEDNPDDEETSLNIPGFVDRHSNTSRVLWEVDADGLFGIPELTNTVVAGHAAFDFDTIIDIDVSPSDLVITDFRNDYSQTSVEMRSSGQSDSLFGWGQTVDFVVGIYALDADLVSNLDTLAGEDLPAFATSPAGLAALGVPAGEIGPLVNQLPALPGTPIDDSVLRFFSQDTASYAVFGQLTWRWTDYWSGVLGLRYGEEKKQAQFNLRTTGPGIIAAVVGAEPFTASPIRDESDFSPTVGLRWDAHENATAFVTYARGFKGGGFNATAETEEGLSFEPEIANNLEFSIKGGISDWGLTFDTALYYTVVENLQVVDFVGTSFQVSNAAEAELRGIEGSIMWQTGWDWLRLTSSLAVSKATYSSYDQAPPPATSDEETQNLTGRTLANAPTHTLSVNPEFTLPQFRELQARLALDFSYRGDQYSAPDLDENAFQKAYVTIGARLVLTPNDGPWSAVMRVNNLTDNRVKDLVIDSAVFDSTYVVQTTQGRSASMSLQFTFE